MSATGGALGCRTLAFAFALGAFAPLGCGRPAALAGGPAHLRVSVLPFLAHAPFYLARDRGYFAAEQLDVEFVRLPPGAPMLAALTHGEIDAAGARPSVAMLAALAAGERLAAVADISHIEAGGCVAGGILARPGLAGDRTPQALVGRRVEVDRAGFENYLLDRLLAPIGRSSADVEAVDLDDAALGEAFARGALDFAFTSEPWSSALVASGRAVVWRSLGELAPDFQASFLLFGPNLLDRRRELGERFLGAYLRAVAALAEPLADEESARLAAELGLPAARLRELCRLPTRRDGALRFDGLADFQRWALERGLLERPAPLERLVDPRFAARAVAAGAGR